jgi:hypothetical protein
VLNLVKNLQHLSPCLACCHWMYPATDVAPLVLFCSLHNRRYQKYQVVEDTVYELYQCVSIHHACPFSFLFTACAIIDCRLWRTPFTSCTKGSVCPHANPPPVFYLHCGAVAANQKPQCHRNLLLKAFVCVRQASYACMPLGSVRVIKVTSAKLVLDLFLIGPASRVALY